MTAIAMPAPNTTTVNAENLTVACNLAAYGLKLIAEGAPMNKIATVFNEIGKISGNKTVSAFGGIEPLTLCSQCSGYLPNYEKFAQCMETCTG